VYDAKPEKIRIVKKNPAPTKKAVPHTKTTAKPRLSEEQLDSLFADSEDETVSKSVQVDPKASLGPGPEKTSNAPKVPGSTRKVEENGETVAETAPVHLEDNNTKHEPIYRALVTATTVQQDTALSSVDEAEEEAMLCEVSPEPVDPSVHSERQKEPVVTAVAKTEKDGQPDDSSPEMAPIPANARKLRRTIGMPGVAVPIPKKKKQRKPAAEVEYADSRTKVETKDSRKSVEKPKVTKKVESAKAPKADEGQVEATASSEEGNSTHLPATPEVDTTQAEVQILKSNDDIDDDHDGKETGAGSSPRDYNRHPMTTSGKKRKHLNDHDTLPSKRLAIEGRNIASPRVRTHHSHHAKMSTDQLQTRRIAPTAALADMREIDTAPVPTGSISSSFEPSYTVSHLHMPMPTAFDDDDEL
jgi:hypothetical protein